MTIGNRMPSDEQNKHFFKIIFPETIDKLTIPPAFITQIDCVRSNSLASLKGPSGVTMTVDLVRDANGMCSSNGWKSFIEDNCISIHDFLLFRYEGNMSFAVSVFDTTGCEKKYDFTSLARRMAVDDNQGGLAVGNGLASALDFSNEIHQHEEIVVKQEEVDYPSVLSHTDHPQTPSQIVKGQSILKLPKISMKASRNQHWNSSNKTRGKFMIKVRKLSVVSNRREVTDDEVKNAYDKAISFTSKNPTMMVVMRECYVYRGFYMNIPVAFIRDHLPAKTCDIILCDPKNIEWTVKFVCYMGRGGFSANWGSFSQANYLELHDVCMFELIQPNKFRVHIFRVVEELTLSSQVRNDVDDSVSLPDFEGKLDATEGNGNNMVLSPTPMKLKNPYFVITIKKYNISSSQPYWRIPTTFELFDYLMEKTSVTLVDLKQHSWKINLRQYYLSSNKSLRSTGGWLQFIRDNELEIGDVCSFELKKKDISPIFTIIFHKSRRDSCNMSPPLR